MIKKIAKKQLGTAYHTWLQSLFHFSYANYHQPSTTFGVLRVINDDILHARSGHDLHKHKEVEILTYLLEGELTHAPMQHEMKTLHRGDLYYVNAGSGIEHGEFNWGDIPVRMIQIWIKPSKRNLTQDVQYASFNQDYAKNQWHLMASPTSTSPIQMHQEAYVWLIELEASKETQFEIKKGRQAYLIQLEGSSIINDEEMVARDGMEIYEDNIVIKAYDESQFILIEMAKS